LSEHDRRYDEHPIADVHTAPFPMGGIVAEEPTALLRPFCCRCGTIPHMIEPTPVLYTQTGCADSRKVRDWLSERGVAFVERNVTGDLDAANELLATGTFATPLFVVDDEQVFGFRPDNLAAALAKGKTD
jgi:glutaredoxin